jgi:aminomethyltransferase
METQTALKTTPLSESHVLLGAKMAPFAGWDMPIQYEGIIAETLHTRKAVSCFDICHMGEFLLKGDAQKSNLDAIVSGSVKDLAIGSCKYSSILNENGGVIDDLLIYRKGAEEWMIVVNAATIEKDRLHFQKHLSRDASFRDVSQDFGKIDLQGPLSREAIRAIAPGAVGLAYYTFREMPVLGKTNSVSRTGYTGELGYEIYASVSSIREVWAALLKDKRVKPAGLGSRDVLRLEMGYSLYGQDIDEKTTPLEAGLEKFIDFGKEFIGRDALLKQKKNGFKGNRIFLKSLSRRSPRHHHKIYAAGKETGVVTSGTFSPHLETGIGMGFGTTPFKTGQNISIGDENLKIDAVVTDKPFLKNTSLKA